MISSKTEMTVDQADNLVGSILHGAEGVKMK